MPEYTLSLRDYWRILRKRKTVVFFTTLTLGFFSFAFATVKKPVPMYSATASVKYEKSFTLTGLYMQTMTWWGSEGLDTQAEIIRSYPVMERAAKKLGYIDPDLTSEQIRSDERLMGIVLNLQSKVSTRVAGYTNIIDITVTSSDPKEAQHLANAMAEAYREYNAEEKNKRIIEARKFIEQQLARKREELRKAEEALRKFREEHDLISLDSRTSEVISELSRARSEYEQLDRTLKEISSMIDQLKRREPLSKEAMGLFADQASGVFRSLNDRLVSLRLQRGTLLKVYTERHPEIQRIDSEIEEVAESMIAELTAQKETLERRKELVEQKLKRLTEEFKALPQEGLILDRLQREVEVIKDVVRLLESKYQEALIKESEKVEEVSIVRPALRPRYPINPPKTKTAAFAGVVMGLVLGVVFAFVVESLDTSIGAIEDVERYLEVPVLGIIPHMGVEEIKRTLLEKYAERDDEETLDMKARLVAHFAPRSTLAESYRALRTNMQFIGLEQGAKTFLITSASRAEGKTTVAVNLAIAIAQAGNRVLLVEGDLRVPMVSRIFGIDKSPGLSEVILGSHRWEDAVRTVTDIMMGKIEMEDLLAVPGMDNLHIITSGGIPPNPAELLSSHRMGEFISQVREQYDVVIFDSAPVLPVADAVVLGSKVDGVLLVYRVGKIGRGALKRAKVQMDSVKANTLGVVLNGLRPEVSPDFQGYRYGRYYGYGQEEGPWWKRLFRMSRFSRKGRAVDRFATVLESLRKERPAPEETGRRKMWPWMAAGLVLLIFALGVGFLWQRGYLRIFTGRIRPEKQGVVQESSPELEISGPQEMKEEPVEGGLPAPEGPQPVPLPGEEGHPYVVHLSSHRYLSLANREVGLLREKGYNAFVASARIPDKGLFYRVLVGDFVTEEEARRTADQLVAAGRAQYAGVLKLPYAILVGSFPSEGAVEREAQKLRIQGLSPYSVRVRLPDEGTEYRLFVGAFATRDEAEAVAGELEKEGISGRIVLR